MRKFTSGNESFFPADYVPNLFPDLVPILEEYGLQEFRHNYQDRALELVTCPDRNRDKLLSLGFSATEIEMMTAKRKRGEFWLVQPTQEDRRAIAFIPHVAVALFLSEYEPKKDKEKPDYGLNNKQAQLDHVYGNYVFLTLRSFNEGSHNHDNDASKQKCLRDLIEARSKPDYGVVDNSVLEILIAECRKANWNDEQSLLAFVELLNQYRRR